jgi:predicted permease
MLRVLAVDPGFRTDNVISLELALSNSDNQQRRVEVLDQVLEALRALPGVSAAGGSDTLPLTHGGYSDGVFAVLNPLQLSDRAKQLIARSANGTDELSQSELKDLVEFFVPLFQDKEHSADADYAKASEGYFQALGIPLKRGRLFNEADGPNSPHVAVISESLARQMWPNQDPLGHTIEFGNMDGDLRLITVVGIVGDVREASLEAAPRPTVYVNYRQRARGLHQFGIVVHGNVAPGTVLEVARRIIHQAAPDTPVKLSTFDEAVSQALSSRRFNLSLVSAFSISALLLAIVGIYGVLAYSVARRTREIGIRVALGATTSNVVRLIVQKALLMAAAGVTAGCMLALLAMRWIAALLYKVSATDTLTYISVALVLLAVALLAALLPARRAARIDPIVALRYE